MQFYEALRYFLQENKVIFSKFLKPMFCCMDNTNSFITSKKHQPISNPPVHTSVSLESIMEFYGQQEKDFVPQRNYFARTGAGSGTGGTF